MQRGDEVVVVDDESTGRYENLAAVHGHPRLTYVRGSIGDEPLVHRVAAEVDEVYHLAAAVGVALIARQPIETIERNIYPTQLLLDKICARVARGESVKIFLASTSEVYGKNPKPVWDEDDDLVFGSTTRARWSYGASKAIDEFLALACWRQSQVPVVIGRFFNVVGPRQSGAYGMVLPRFVKSALAGEPLVVHDDGLQVRCFAHVHDVIRMVIALMAEPKRWGACSTSAAITRCRFWNWLNAWCGSPARRRRSNSRATRTPTTATSRTSGGASPTCPASRRRSTIARLRPGRDHPGTGDGAAVNAEDAENARTVGRTSKSASAALPIALP